MPVLAVAALIGLSCWWWQPNPLAGARRLARLAGHRPRARFAGRLGQRPSPSPAARAEIPAALDLLAACLSAGAMLEAALAAVATAFDGPVGALLTDIAELTALGAPPEDAWATALRDERWAVAARAVVRAHHSGAALTDVLNRVASDLRHDLRARAGIAAARASVKAVLPLGVCFLPAFLLVGVVPSVAGFTTSLW